MILKNTASQGVYLFASDKTTGVGLAGDQANITGAISKDGSAEAAFATANPTNIGGGLYWQPLSQAETNCNAFGMRWTSSTSNILIEPIVGFTEQGRIDATMSSRAPAATALLNTTWTDTKAGYVDASISSRSVAGSAMTLTTGERTAIANEVEAQIIDETDTEKVLLAITNKIAAANPDLSGLTLSAIASSVRSILGPELARIDTEISTRMATFAYTSPPSASTIATATSSTLAPRFDDIDAAIGSLDGGGGSTPPTPEEIAAQVDSKIAPRFSGLSTYDGGPVASVTAPVTVGTIGDKDGYSLAPTGLDSILTSLVAVPTNFREWLMLGIHRLCGKSEKEKVSESEAVIRVFGSDPTAVVTQQTVTTTSTKIQIGPPSAP